MKSLNLVLLICAFLMGPPTLMAAETGQAVGTVAEAIDSGGYIYLKLEGGTWIAANSFVVSKGDEIQYTNGMEMNGFYSKSLDRTFDSILFVSSAGLVDNKGNGLPATTMIPELGEIKALQDGKTVVAVYAESAELVGQVVSINARVTKVSEDIMGKNWITLHDGTGSDPDNRLLATSQEMVAPGTLVIAKGTVVTDVDLGYGYTYKVLLEEATFTPGIE